MFDLGFIVPMVPTTPLSVIRYSGAYNSAGIWSQTLASTITGRASVQPLSGADVKRLPENMRNEIVVKLWFDQDLVIATEGGTPGDRFTFDGDSYEVQAKVAWGSTANYNEYLARKLVQ